MEPSPRCPPWKLTATLVTWQVRAAGNEISAAGGAALAGATLESNVLLDLSQNCAVAYADLVAIKLSNNRRAASAPPSPLDGWGKREE